MEVKLYHQLSHVERAFADIAQGVGHEQIVTLTNAVAKRMADGAYKRCKNLHIEQHIPLIMARAEFNACMDAAAKAAGITLDRVETLDVRMYLASEIAYGAFNVLDDIMQMEEN